MIEKKRRGRPLKEDEPLRVKSIRFTEKDFSSFETWCRERGFTISEALRSLIKFVEFKESEK